MTPASFKFSEPVSGRVMIWLIGTFDESDAVAFEEALQSRFRERALGGLHVLYYLDGVEKFNVLARAVLIRAHRFLARRSRRTAFIASSAVLRGLALFVVSQADDPDAKVVASQTLADQWLASDVTRMQDAFTRLEATVSRLTQHSRRAS